MKKILLLFIMSLAMLMADFTLIGEQLTPTGAETPPSTSGTVNSYLEPIDIPAYDSGNQSHLLITASNGRWTSANLNSATYKHFYVEPGDYSATTITLTADGIQNDRRTISLHNGNDTHPASLSEALQANVRLKWNNASYWTLDRLSNIDMSNSDVAWFYGGSSYNIINRFNMLRYYYGMTLYHGANYNTIQNSYFDHMTHAGRLSDNVAIALTSYGQCDGTLLIGNKVINNDFRNAGDAFQLVRSGACTGADTISYEGTIVDSNRMWMDGDVYTNGDYATNGYNANGQYMIGENALDFKRGSEDPANPVIITNNIMWGYKQGDKTAGGSFTSGAGKAITSHFGVNNLNFENNIVFDSQTLWGVSGEDSPIEGSILNTTIKNNIFFHSGYSNPISAKMYPLFFYGTKAITIEDNSFIDFASGNFIRFQTSYAGSAFRRNIMIDASTSSTDNGWSISDNHMYASPNSLGGTGNTSYTTTAEANMADHTFEYERFSTVPKSKTLTGVISTGSSPHYGLAGSSITE